MPIYLRIQRDTNLCITRSLGAHDTESICANMSLSCKLLYKPLSSDVIVLYKSVKAYAYIVFHNPLYVFRHDVGQPTEKKAEEAEDAPRSFKRALPQVRATMFSTHSEIITVTNGACK